jgi:DNA-binding MarR family transcriptional regulator
MVSHGTACYDAWAPMRSSVVRAREATAILDDLRRIVRTLRESSRAAEGALGVSGAQLFVLQTLASSPALSLNALAERTRTHQSSVSAVVKRLVESELVARRASSEDARRLELELTARGRALLKRAPFAAQDRLIRGVDEMPAAERRLLARGLRALLDAMHLDESPPAMFFEEDHGPQSRSETHKPRKRRVAT